MGYLKVQAEEAITRLTQGLWLVHCSHHASNCLGHSCEKYREQAEEDSMCLTQGLWLIHCFQPTSIFLGHQSEKVGESRLKKQACA